MYGSTDDENNEPQVTDPITTFNLKLTIQIVIVARLKPQCPIT